MEVAKEPDVKVYKTELAICSAYEADFGVYAHDLEQSRTTTLSQGLYAGAVAKLFPQHLPGSSTQPDVFPPIVGPGVEALLATNSKKGWKSFALPKDLLHEYKRLELMDAQRKTRSTDRPSPFIPIRHNARTSTDKLPVNQCSCDPPDEDQQGCGAHCINRMLFYECDPRTCPVGSQCSNRRFQRRQYARTHVQWMGNRGWGLVASKGIRAGDFVIEYCGEVVDETETARRLDQYGSEKNFYLLAITSHSTIDATRMGNKARFINHSCEPSCSTQMWTVRGNRCMGIFANRDIAKGEEITFDYQFERIGGTKQRCYCGAPSCRQFLGAKKTKRVAVEEDPIFMRVAKREPTGDMMRRTTGDALFPDMRALRRVQQDLKRRRRVEEDEALTSLPLLRRNVLECSEEAQRALLHWWPASQKPLLKTFVEDTYKDRGQRVKSFLTKLEKSDEDDLIVLSPVPASACWSGWCRAQEQASSSSASRPWTPTFEMVAENTQSARNRTGSAAAQPSAAACGTALHNGPTPVAVASPTRATKSTSSSPARAAKGTSTTSPARATKSTSSSPARAAKGTSNIPTRATKSASTTSPTRATRASSPASPVTQQKGSSNRKRVTARGNGVAASTVKADAHSSAAAQQPARVGLDLRYVVPPKRKAAVQAERKMNGASAFAKGQTVLALWSDDGKWYRAVIHTMHKNGDITVGLDDERWRCAGHNVKRLDDSTATPLASSAPVGGVARTRKKPKKTKQTVQRVDHSQASSAVRSSHSPIPEELSDDSAQHELVDAAMVVDEVGRPPRTPASGGVWKWSTSKYKWVRMAPCARWHDHKFYECEVRSSSQDSSGRAVYDVRFVEDGVEATVGQGDIASRIVESRSPWNRRAKARVDASRSAGHKKRKKALQQLTKLGAKQRRTNRQILAEAHAHRKRKR